MLNDRISTDILYGRISTDIFIWPNQHGHFYMAESAGCVNGTYGISTIGVVFKPIGQSSKALFGGDDGFIAQIGFCSLDIEPV